MGMSLQILEQVGQGGFATVYRGRLGGRKVAIKRTFGGQASPGRRCAAKEFAFLQSLRHKNVIEFVAAAESVIFTDLILEFCVNGSLQGLIHGPRGGRVRSRFPAERLNRQAAAAQLISAIHYCHYGFDGYQIIHCDIKPDNVLITSGGILKLCDFGLAKKAYCGKCETRSYDGTPGYRAPEILCCRPYGPAVDLWSLGCTLYELFTGKYLFHEVLLSATSSEIGLLRDANFMVNANTPRTPTYNSRSNPRRSTSRQKESKALGSIGTLFPYALCCLLRGTSAFVRASDVRLSTWPHVDMNTPRSDESVSSDMPAKICAKEKTSLASVEGVSISVNV
ncbi:kinase-like protein [Microstroma glucosiphilum]|uniref:non-specific serine/threonine protein kinase n=1 Tax=Pseudomicrostroma glucosiphilum TaxID=1684307 RepID=A0A316U5Z0_9BASI|nr:kinase-like protein [Pseudomicrostroma glucosiphilum]PWN18375.1 kinase-like protein [Pseudomicrostroma glucosiphilum]